MQNPNEKTYLTPPRLDQKLIIWGFYPSEALVLIALFVGAVFFVFRSMFTHTWLILFPFCFAVLKIRIGENRQNLEHLLNIRFRFLREAQVFTLLECFSSENVKKKKGRKS